MPRLTKQLPKYRMHRASGQAFVELNGHRHYLGPHKTKSSELEYDRLIGEWLANGRQPLNSSNDLLLVELCLRYCEYAEGHYKKNGRSTRVTPGIKCALRYLKQLYSNSLASEFGPLALKAVLETMIREGHSRRYINDHLGRIKRMFSWAVSEQLVPAATYEALRHVKGLQKGRTGWRVRIVGV